MDSVYNTDISDNQWNVISGIIDEKPRKRKYSLSGIDGGKKVKGRKQHIVVDVFGFLIGLAVHDASIHDSVGANSVLEAVKGKSTRLAR